MVGSMAGMPSSDLPSICGKFSARPCATAPRRPTAQIIDCSSHKRLIKHANLMQSRCNRPAYCACGGARSGMLPVEFPKPLSHSGSCVVQAFVVSMTAPELMQPRHLGSDRLQASSGAAPAG